MLHVERLQISRSAKAKIMSRSMNNVDFDRYTNVWAAVPFERRNDTVWENRTLNKPTISICCSPPAGTLVAQKTLHQLHLRVRGLYCVSRHNFRANGRPVLITKSVRKTFTKEIYLSPYRPLLEPKGCIWLPNQIG